MKSMLLKAANYLGTSELRWIDVVDCYGYDWEFSEEYAVSSEGEIVSFKREVPAILSLKDNHGYPQAVLCTAGEKLSIAVSQIVHQVWGLSPRLPKYVCARLNGDSQDVQISNLVQVKHWRHARNLDGGWKKLENSRSSGG